MKTKIGIVGCGSIGTGIALFLNKDMREQVCLCALADKDEKAAQNLKNRLDPVPDICAIDCLIGKSDLVIEAASVEAAKYVLKKAVQEKKDVFILSVGALLDSDDIIAEAEKNHVKIYVPSGAICGADGLGALSVHGGIKKISLVTSKPPAGFVGAAYLAKKNIDITGLTEEKVIFRGTVKEAIANFPQNINVAATLYLAAGRKDVEVCIKANPALKRNVHRIEVEAEQARINIEVENVPAKTNPKTSALAILSAQALLRKIFSSFKIGS
jgi:aspartate dehydrogenase